MTVIERSETNTPYRCSAIQSETISQQAVTEND